MTQGEWKIDANQSKSRGGLYLATVVLLLLLPFLGLRGANVYVNAYQTGALSRWKRLKPLPARGIDIVGATSGTVYVRVVEGDYYACRHRSGFFELKRCWYRVQSVPIDARRAPSDRLYREIEVKPPPAGAVVDTFESTLAGAEAWSQTLYRLMEDGTVFVWHCHGGIGSWLTIGLGCLGGLAVAGVVIALLWIRAGRRN